MDERQVLLRRIRVLLAILILGLLVRRRRLPCPLARRPPHTSSRRPLPI